MRSDVPSCWLPLLQRLEADGINSNDVQPLFVRLGDSFSPAPMATKIMELFKIKFMAKPQDAGKPASQAPRIYPNVVTRENIAKIRAYLKKNARAFAYAEKTYGVPKHILAGLLMVETRLGETIGKERAFWSLACMAAARDPEQIAAAVASLPVTEAHMPWIRERLENRSNWAYSELKALVFFGKEQGTDILGMPGSVYGAIGICQFMPSNLKPYAADGDGDGTIDLFTPADAIASAGNFLKGHGWKRAMPRAQQQTALMRYNRSATYANTILALSDALAPPKPQPKAKIPAGTAGQAQKKAAAPKAVPSKTLVPPR